MGSPLNKGQGLRGSRNARSEPQCAWDSFLLASSALEASKGGTCLCLETMSASQAEVGVERNVSEGRMLGAVPPQEQTSRRRGRPRKNKERGGEDRLPAEMSAHATAEQFTMHTVWPELVGTTNRGSGRGKGKAKTPISPVGSPI
jgi:hypothetical protein